MIEFIQHGDTTGVLTFDGKMTLEHTQALKAALMEAVESCEHVMLRIDNVAEAHASCLRVICLAHRTALALNKRLTLTPMPSLFQVQAMEGDGCKTIGCDLGGSKRCFWNIGATNG